LHGAAMRSLPTKRELSLFRPATLPGRRWLSDISAIGRSGDSVGIYPLTDNSIRRCSLKVAEAEKRPPRLPRAAPRPSKSAVARRHPRLQDIGACMKSPMLTASCSAEGRSGTGTPVANPPPGFLFGARSKKSRPGCPERPREQELPFGNYWLEESW
jgi:hypothetical protein